MLAALAFPVAAGPERSVAVGPGAGSLVLEAERVVLGRVESVAPVELPDTGAGDDLRLATVRVQRTLVGPDGGDVLHVAGAERYRPRPGAPAIVFVERLETEALDEATRARLAAESGGAPLWRPVADARSLDGRRRVLAWWSIEDPSRVDAIVERLDREVDRVLPVVHARYVTNSGLPGPGARSPNWGLRVGPDLMVFEDGVPTGTLPEERWKGLVRRIEQQGFWEMPARVGISRGPCEPVVELECRSRRGQHTIRILRAAREPAAGEAGESDDDWLRATRLWEGLPGDRRPTL